MNWFGPSEECGCCEDGVCCPDTTPLRVQFTWSALSLCGDLDGTYTYDIDQTACNINGGLVLVAATADGSGSCPAGSELRVYLDLNDPLGGTCAIISATIGIINYTFLQASCEDICPGDTIIQTTALGTASVKLLFT